MSDHDYDVFLEILRTDLYSFIGWALGVLEPGGEFKANWHIAAIAYQLSRIFQGDNTRLLITMPPRSLKSLSVSVASVAWALGRNPALKFIVACYGEKPSNLLAQQTRTLMRHPDYKAAFPLTIFAENSPLEMLATTAGGYRLATSVGGAATGFGADFVIADDLSKAESSSGDREKTLAFYQSSMLSRFNDKSKGAAIVVGQRIAVDDLPGYLINQGQYTHLDLPAIAQADETVDVGPGQTFLRHKGEVLHRERESLETLERIRRDIGDDVFAAQYLQRPNLALGAYFDERWLGRYEKPLPLNRYAHRVISIDTALSTSTTADYSVMSVFGVTDDHQDLLHVWRDKVGYEDLSKKLDELIAKFKATHVIIEAAGAGISLLERLNQLYYCGVIPFQPIRSKEDRVKWQIEFFRRKTIRLPMQADWLATFENEIFTFPGSLKDDQMDTLTQFANYARIGFDAWDKLDLHTSGNYRGQIWIPGERRDRSFTGFGEG